MGTNTTSEAATEQQPSYPDPTSGQPASAVPLQVLILEDRAMDADLVIRQLRRAGFIIETTIAVDEATYLAALDPPPDIILADYSLPRFEALSALRHLRTRNLDIPLIVVTGTITEETAVAALREGTADYLLKDRLVRLPDAVRRALADREARQRERQAEQALRDSEARYRSVSELTSDFAFSALVHSDQTLSFAWITDAVAPITGYAAADLKTFDDVACHIHPDDLPVLRAQLLRAMSGQRVSCDCRLITRLGDERLLRVHARPVHDQATGQVVRIDGAAQDLTEQRRSEIALQEANSRLSDALAELKQTQQQMVQQERLRALGEMASGIAHDFNNALTMILGFSELMLAEPELLADPEQARQNIALMHVAAQDAATIVGRLRDLYRERQIDEDVELVDLQAVVRASIALTEPRWRTQAQAEGVHLTVRDDLHDGCTVLASESDLRELLTNLIINAVDACQDGGEIVVRTRPDGGDAVLEVVDSGHGMTEEVRARCLEPFFTTKQDRGTGLGLPMVFGIVRRHGGSIAIDSAPGQGTTIGVRLPAVHLDLLVAPAATERADQGPWNILVVDDEESVRRVLRGYLQHGGHHVLGVPSGHEALGIVVAQPIDLVILDRVMPDMNGDRLATRIRDVSPDTRIMMVSGIGPASGEDGTAPAVDASLSKPVRLDELLTAVSRTMAHRPTELTRATDPLRR